MPIVDETLIFDNSIGQPELIAEKTKVSALKILNETKFDQLKTYYHGTI